MRIKENLHFEKTKHKGKKFLISAILGIPTF